MSVLQHEIHHDITREQLLELFAPINARHALGIGTEVTVEATVKCVHCCKRREVTLILPLGGEVAAAHFGRSWKCWTCNEKSCGLVLIREWLP